jgi:hypothetical protein
MKQAEADTELARMRAVLDTLENVETFAAGLPR